MNLLASLVGSFVTGSVLGTLLLGGGLLSPVIASQLLPREARGRWRECWRGEIGELARGTNNGHAWLWYSYALPVAAVRIRIDRRNPRGWWARVVVWGGRGFPRGTDHVTPCPQSPGSDALRPEGSDRRP